MCTPSLGFMSVINVEDDVHVEHIVEVPHNNFDSVKISSEQPLDSDEGFPVLLKTRENTKSIYIYYMHYVHIYMYTM